MPAGDTVMMEEWTAALEATALASGLRGSVWAYPLVNAGHILGVALLVGAIVPLDLRLLGVWPATPLYPLWRVLSRTASVGLALAIVCGALLFAARASDYVHSSLFLSKMGFVAAGLLNAVALRGAMPDERMLERPSPGSIPWRLRAVACVSLVAWLTALVLGRLIGYF